MDLFTLLLSIVMAGLALTGAGLLVAMVVLERPSVEPAAALPSGRRSQPMRAQHRCR